MQFLYNIFAALHTTVILYFQKLFFLNGFAAKTYSSKTYLHEFLHLHIKITHLQISLILKLLYTHLNISFSNQSLFLNYCYQVRRPRRFALHRGLEQYYFFPLNKIITSPRLFSLASQILFDKGWIA